MFEIEPASSHSQTTHLGTRQHTHLHSLLHKTTWPSLLRPSPNPELDSFVFRKIESSIASRDHTASAPRQGGIRSTKAHHSTFVCSATREHNNYPHFLDPPLRSAGRTPRAIFTRLSPTKRDDATCLHRGFIRESLRLKPFAMQLTSILSAALLPLIVLAQDTISGTTTLTQTSTMTKTVTLASNTVTMTATNSSSIETTSSATRSSSRATATSSSSSETPGVNGLGNGAASLGSSHVAIAGVAGMIVVALM